MFLDVGGSMDPHVRVVEELFSAARSEFKHLEYFYFHNCLYEGVWRDNRRRWDAQTPTAEILRTYGPDYRVIFVGDAAMSPYEITHPGGACEHWNAESGEAWLARVLATWRRAVWLNPTPEAAWGYTPLGRDDRGALRGPDVPDDAGGPRGGDPRRSDALSVGRDTAEP